MSVDILENNNDKYKVKLDIFEGPLDLLLHLTKTSEIDIYDIPLADITNQYLIYLSFLVYLDLDNITEFVEMATTLILIKTRAMLPIEFEFDEEEEDPREGLISTLLEYQKYKIAAGILEIKGEESIPIIKRSDEPFLFHVDDEEDSNWKQLSVLDLIGAFAEVLNKSKESETTLEVVLYNYTVDDKIIYIKKILEDKDSFNYFEIIRDGMPKLELICTFLAILELVKLGMVVVRQHIIFGDIYIVKRNMENNI